MLREPQTPGSMIRTLHRTGVCPTDSQHSRAKPRMRHACAGVKYLHLSLCPCASSVSFIRTSSSSGHVAAVLGKKKVSCALSKPDCSY